MTEDRKLILSDNGASTEGITPEGNYKMSVLLKQNPKTITIEISYTTMLRPEEGIGDGIATELHCLVDPGTNNPLLQLLHAFAQQAFASRPENIAQEEKRMHGFRVNIHHRDLTEEEAETKRYILDAIAKGGKRK